MVRVRVTRVRVTRVSVARVTMLRVKVVRVRVLIDRMVVRVRMARVRMVSVRDFRGVRGVGLIPVCDFLHLILVQYDLGLEKQARGTCLDIFAVYESFMASFD